VIGLIQFFDAGAEFGPRVFCCEQLA